MASQQTHLRAIVNHDGAAILDTKAGRISTLNSTGAIVWQALERGECAETIAADLAHRTRQPIEVVKEDIAAFIDALKNQNLLP